MSKVRYGWVDIPVTAAFDRSQDASLWDCLSRYESLLGCAESDNDDDTLSLSVPRKGRRVRQGRDRKTKVQSTQPLIVGRRMDSTVHLSKSPCFEISMMGIMGLFKTANRNPPHVLMICVTQL